MDAAGISVDVFVKSGVDGRRVAACPLGHAAHMAALITTQQQPCALQVRPVCVSGPAPSDFQKTGLRRVPAIIVSDGQRRTTAAVDGADEVLAVLAAQFPQCGLQKSSPDAELASGGVFSSFCKFMRAACVTPDHSQLVDRCWRRLLDELARLDVFLANSTWPSGPFLGEARRVGSLDCELMSKLHHIRVACSLVAGRNIEQRFSALWRYLHLAYSLPAFVASCPCDQEIVLHWTDRHGFPPLSYERHKTICRQTPTFSLDVPARAVPCMLKD